MNLDDKLGDAGYIRSWYGTEEGFQGMEVGLPCGAPGVANYEGTHRVEYRACFRVNPFFDISKALEVW
jgi:hypothetical protein